MKQTWTYPTPQRLDWVSVIDHPVLQQLNLEVTINLAIERNVILDTHTLYVKR